jgi:oligoendopeptidase F
LKVEELVIELKRTYLPEGFDPGNWDSLQPLYNELSNREINSTEDLHRWFHAMSELDAAIAEHVGWLYIKMTCNTQDKSLSDAYAFFIEQVNPLIEPYDDLLNKKIIENPFIENLDSRYQIYIRQVKNAIRLFREENIPINAELSVKEQQFGEIAGAMTVDVDGKTLTLQQAANYLKEPDRAKRDKVYHQIISRRLADREKLDALFSELILLRDKKARNAGFSNYRDYKFVDLDRFDYSPDDCLKFHEAVEKAVIPVLDQLMAERKEKMQVSALKPWDLEVDPLGQPDLKPFKEGKELLEKSIECFSEINSYFGKVLTTLKQRGYTDLDSRIGKAPGGYNYPLYESGVPFIFMNASGSLRDVITMVHEGGHAIHSMLTHELEFIGFKEIPSEVAELASMSMELISMEHWQHFFRDNEELRRAKKEQLENIIEALPWIACIDAFQHWLYLNPNHSVEERTEAWRKNICRFSSSIVDWNGEEEALEVMWQKQLHLFEVPFYYIEYGMAQLGAIAVWKNYKSNPQNAIGQYMEALKLGYTCSIAEIYSTAGIRFDFSAEYIRELILFVKEELEKV